MKLIFLTLGLLSASATALAIDSHPQICLNIRTQIDEDCSEEPNTIDQVTKKPIKRTYEECYKEDMTSTVEKLNTYMIDELGIAVYDATGESDQIVCDN